MADIYSNLANFISETEPDENGVYYITILNDGKSHSIKRNSNNQILKNHEDINNKHRH
tara:strand:- start:1955 stop:2128 length:174 start_codon:yes stop_codon:yes gene_type:complete